METSHDINKYWTYCGIKIPMHIKSVPSIDGGNTRYRDGSETELFGLDMERFTLKEYQDAYSIIGNNGELYWKLTEDIQEESDYKPFKEYEEKQKIINQYKASSRLDKLKQKHNIKKH